MFDMNTKSPDQKQVHKQFFQQSKQFFATIYHHGWDMNPPLHARNETVVQAVGGSGGLAQKKTKSAASAGKNMTSGF